jgi:hypothetical protein
LSFDILLAHGTAFFCTFPTRLSAFATMVIIVLTTFISTCLADIRTDSTNCLCTRATLAHELGGSIANDGTFDIELNAMGHHFYIFLHSAGSSTIVTNSRTTQASFYTALVLSICIHDIRFKKEF